MFDVRMLASSSTYIIMNERGIMIDDIRYFSVSFFYLNLSFDCC